MKTIIPQRGVGMIEVLISLLLLAIGVLGFSALQLRAIDATAEGLNRVQGMSLARDLAERIRANRLGYDTYKTNVNASPAVIVSKTCVGSTTCTAGEMAAYDVSQVLNKAAAFNAKIAIPECQGVDNGRKCIYVAWDKTNPVDGTTDTSCTNGGTYQPMSKCVVVEAY